MERTQCLQGRLVEILSSGKGLLQNQTGIHQMEFEAGAAQPGDIVEVRNRVLRVLTPNRAPGRTHSWMDRTLAPRRMRNLQVRTQVEASIRAFFAKKRFLETRTPLLVPSPGMEPHIRPFQISGTSSFLPTSPEFAMKKLLSGGLERIFQICPAFRHEPHSVTHHPEFTMLEWYRAYAGYETIMEDTEQLLAQIAHDLTGKAQIQYEGRTISFEPPWPRIRVRDLFLEHARIDLVSCSEPQALARECQRLGLATNSSESWDDLYFKIWLNLIEPKLPADRAVFVTRYPASQAALATLDSDPDGSQWAKRFEVYAGGFELGNAFEELTDPEEQRSRFLKDQQIRTELYGDTYPRSPIDEEFLHALEEGMPPSGGIAVGVDRLVMLFTGETEIEQTLWLNSGKPNC